MRSAGSALVLGALVACTPPGGPSLASITPSSGPNVADTPVQIIGTDFRLPLVADLDHGDIAVGTLSATIAGVPLTSVVQRDGATIDAVVPAGLPLGLHDVVVNFGARTATLPDGYTVSGSTLVSSLSVAPWLGKGNTFTVIMTVTNNGADTVDSVTPSMLATSGTATTTLVGAPTVNVSLPPGGMVSAAFGYSADSYGTLTFTGNATGTDVASASAISSPITMVSTDVVETAVVATDPFGDGSKFTYVAGYHDQVYLGPNDTGTRAVRMNADGTNLESLTFTFTRDTTGNTSQNGTPMYTSIGATGCIGDTAACGPDNENGRGFFASGTLGGNEWLVIGGGKSGGDLDYVYMTSDTDTTLDFRYVDLSPVMGGATRGFSAAFALNDRLYLGFPDDGGARPYFIALLAPPTAPGLDTTSATAINLDANSFPAWQPTNTVMIDSMTDLNGMLYVASIGGVMMATVTAPRPYGVGPADWGISTPSSVVFSGKGSRPTTKLADLLPEDRAFPQMAVYNNHIFVGRNTTTGPQLWSCDPTLGVLADRCEPGDWVIVAANTTGDLALTQFDDPSFTSISMVVATPHALYVGFDSNNGVRVFRSSAAVPFFPSDFEAVGGPGLGSAGNTHILDAKMLKLSTGASVWVTAGNHTTALQLVVIP